MPYAVSPVTAAARRISNDLQFSDADVNRAVELFIHQMDEGLERDGATLSQIPSYVSAVPIGTEKVGLDLRVRATWYDMLTVDRDCT